ncbi:protein FAM110C isoform X2 [Myotis daubentonii]|uniref:protein FAM110C isoform X2 n=1 Tax=Myotis daubentonii TaxID=98922 RepID=UPI002873CBF6|nr:protein FAM110C isoform X2 [Myotis daubentonii]
MRALPGPDAPQMEQLLPGHPDAARPALRSAVERLAADRAKYVRALPGTAWGPASEGSSPGAGGGQAVDPRPPARAPGAVARRAIPRRPLRPDSLVIYRQKCEFARGPGADGLRDSLARKRLPGPGKDRTPTPPETSPAGEKGRAAGAEVTPTKPGPAAAPVRPARPSTPAAPPTTLPARPSTPAAPPTTLPARPSVPTTPPERPSVPVAPLMPPARPSVPASPPTLPARPSVPVASPTPPARPSVPAAPPTTLPARPSVPTTPPERPSVPVAPPTPPSCPSVRAASGTRELQAARRRGLQRSQSDLSSRYSKSAAEFDTFFQFCGLEPEVVEALGRENFSAGSDQGTLRVRSVSVATSEGGFSRRSCGDEGLQEEELTEQAPSAPSVVERNARIIKWLYTCRKATETPAPRWQGPRDHRAEAGTHGFEEPAL